MMRALDEWRARGTLPGAVVGIVDAAPPFTAGQGSLQGNTSDGRATGSRRPLRARYDIAAMVKP